MNKQWRLVAPSTFNAEGKKYLEIAIVKEHEATAHGGMEKSMKGLTDKFEFHCFFCLVKEYVRSSDICQRTNYLQGRPIGYIIPLHVPVRQ